MSDATNDEQPRRRKRGTPAGRDSTLARERRALQLRIVGRLSYSEIAAKMLPCPAHAPNGFADCELCDRLYASKASAQRAVVRALARDFPPLSDEQRRVYVAEEQATIEQLMARTLRDALDSSLDSVDRMRAVNAAVQLMRRKANLLGLDERLRSESDDALDAEIQQLLDELTGH